jgi:hypothetical protein
MPRQSEEIVVFPSGYDRDKMQGYQRRIERFQERQLAARARSIEAQRRFRVFTGIVIGGLLVSAALSVFVAWSLGQLKQSVAAQLQSAEVAVAASNERWKDARQALIENRKALEASEQTLARFRAETRAGLLLSYVDSYLDRRLSADDSADRGLISAKLKELVQPALVRQLTQAPDAPDAQLTSAIEKLVDARLPAIIERTRRPAR